MKRRLLIGLGVAAAVVVPTLVSPLHALAVTGTGTVTINNTIVPCTACSATGGAMTSDPGLFNLQIDGSTAGTGANVGTGGTTGAVTVPSTDTGQAHTIGETAGTSTALDTYFAAYSCTDGAMTTTGDATGPFTINVFNNATITCTITNTRTAAGGPRAQSVLGSGSDTTQFMMQSLDGLYMFSPGCQQIQLPTGSTKFFDFSCLTPDPTGTVTTENYEHDQAHEAYFLGSGNGITQIAKMGQAGIAHADYARSSRAPATSDVTGEHFVAYAKDGISWEAFDTGVNGVTGINNQSGTCSGSGGTTVYCLSQAQLQGIYISCTITNWSQVGGANIPISIYTPQSGSGTRLTWDSFLTGGNSALGNSQNCIPADQLATHVIPENANAAIPVSDQVGSIFPFSEGIFKTQVNGKGGSILGAIDKKLPTTANIQLGSFPYTRFLFNVFCGPTCSASIQNPNAAQAAAAVNYVGEEGWICKLQTNHGTNPITGNNYRADIATAIGNAGFVPLLQGAIGGGDPNQDFCKLTVTP